MSRPMARNSALSVALLVSLLFHLSMVSVFSIVIRFPHRASPAIALGIVQTAEEIRHALPRQVLRMSFPQAFTDPALMDELSVAPGDELPSIELPRLEMTDSLAPPAEERNLKLRSQFSGLIEPPPAATPDSWALFTHELRGISLTLSQWTALGPPTKPKHRLPIATQAPGLGISVEWMSEPRDRKVLFAPPIQALWRFTGLPTDEPISVVFTVDALGKVTDIQAPVEDDAGVVADIKKTLLKYRFEPLSEGGKSGQRGTLIVAPEPETE